MGLIRDLTIRLLRGRTPLPQRRGAVGNTQQSKTTQTDNDQYVGDSVREACYELYSHMEKDAILSPALNIYADEVAAGTGLSSSPPFVINTDSRQAAKAIDVFQKTVKIEDELYMNFIHDTCRDVAQFGDVIFEIVCDKKRVLSLAHLLPESMRYIKMVERWVYKDGSEKLVDTYRYQQRQTDRGWVTFEPWQIAHLRGVRSLSKHWGFTSSIFWPIQSVWKLLHFMVDAMAIDRVYSSHHARLFLVDTGAYAGDEAWEHVRQMKESYSRTPRTDPNTGELLLWGGMPIPEDDLWVPHGPGCQTSVEELYGSHYRPITDIEFVVLLVCVGLGVPPQRLGILRDVRTRSVMDTVYLQFSKNVQRIRLAIERGIGKAIELQLSLAGLRPEEHRFWFTWPPISIERILSEMETMKLRSEIASTLTLQTGVFLSDEWIYKEVLGMSDETIRDMMLKKPAEFVPKSLFVGPRGGLTRSPLSVVSGDKELAPEQWKALVSNPAFEKSLENLRGLLELERGRSAVGRYRV